jgi:hypothetical protein
MRPRHPFEHPDDLAGVAVFVVVPDVEDQVRAVGDGRRDAVLASTEVSYVGDWVVRRVI